MDSDLRKILDDCIHEPERAAEREKQAIIWELQTRRLSDAAMALIGGADGITAIQTSKCEDFSEGLSEIYPLIGPWRLYPDLKACIAHAIKNKRIEGRIVRDEEENILGKKSTVQIDSLMRYLKENLILKADNHINFRRFLNITIHSYAIHPFLDPDNDQHLPKMIAASLIWENFRRRTTQKIGKAWLKNYIKQEQSWEKNARLMRDHYQKENRTHDLECTENQDIIRLKRKEAISGLSDNEISEAARMVSQHTSPPQEDLVKATI